MKPLRWTDVNTRTHTHTHTQHCLQLINNGASIQVELDLAIVEIYVDQHSYFKVSLSLFSCYLINEYLIMLFFGTLLGVTHCAPNFYEYFVLH